MQRKCRTTPAASTGTQPSKHQFELQGQTSRTGHSTQGNLPQRRFKPWQQSFNSALTTVLPLAAAPDRPNDRSSPAFNTPNNPPGCVMNHITRAVSVEHLRNNAESSGNDGVIIIGTATLFDAPHRLIFKLQWQRRQRGRFAPAE